MIISVTGKDVSAKLIQALIAVYLGDDARTDAISSRLREVCPGLYNQDDALSSKAQEILIKARNQMNPRQKETMIQEAISISKDVAIKLNLEVLTTHLVAVHAYIGVVEVCLSAASKRDPQNLALHFYKNGEPNEDTQGKFVTFSWCFFFTKYSHFYRFTSLRGKNFGLQTYHKYDTSIDDF